MEAACEKTLQVGAHDGVGLLEIDIAHATQQRGDDDTRRMPERIVGRQGLPAKHIKARAGDASAAQRLEQCLLVQYPARAALIRKALGFSAAMTWASIRLSVCAEYGTSSTRKSASAAARTSSSRVNIRSNPAERAHCGRHRRPSCRRPCSGAPGSRRSLHADDDDGVAPQQGLRPALPVPSRLVALHARKIARQGQHVQEHQLRHLRSVHAAGGSQYGLRPKRGQLQDGVGSGGQRLDPAQARRALEQRIIELEVVADDGLGLVRALKRDGPVVVANSGRSGKSLSARCANWPASASGAPM